MKLSGGQKTHCKRKGKNRRLFLIENRNPLTRNTTFMLEKLERMKEIYMGINTERIDFKGCFDNCYKPLQTLRYYSSKKTKVHPWNRLKSYMKALFVTQNCSDSNKIFLGPLLTTDQCKRWDCVDIKYFMELKFHRKTMFI